MACILNMISGFSFPVSLRFTNMNTSYHIIFTSYKYIHIFSFVSCHLFGHTNTFHLTIVCVLIHIYMHIHIHAHTKLLLSLILFISKLCCLFIIFGCKNYMYMYIYMYIYIYVYIYIYMYICIYT